MLRNDFFIVYDSSENNVENGLKTLNRLVVCLHDLRNSGKKGEYIYRQMDLTNSANFLFCFLVCWISKLLLRYVFLCSLSFQLVL